MVDEITRIIVDSYFKNKCNATTVSRELEIPRTTVRRRLKKAKESPEFKDLFEQEDPKILFWDIETGFNKAAIFGLFNQYLPFTSILNERYIICASFKLADEKRVDSISVLDDMDRFKEDPTDDRYVVGQLHKVLSGVDVIVAHYGDNFDVKYFNTRALFHGLNPLPNIKQIDTVKMAKQKFMFNSNKLDYIARFLEIGKKVKTDDQLWLDCLSGKVEAVKKMIGYNKRDVEILEGVFYKLRPFCRTPFNFAIYKEGCCPACGSNEVVKDGFVTTMIYKYQSYKCEQCGHRFRDGKAIKEFDSSTMRH